VFASSEDDAVLHHPKMMRPVGVGGDFPTGPLGDYIMTLRYVSRITIL